MSTWVYLLHGKIHNMDYDMQTSIYNSFRQLVYKDIYFLLRDHTLTDDVVQESFMKVMMNAQKIRHHSNYRSWVHKVARNTAIDYIRKNKKHLQSLNNGTCPLENRSTIEAFPSEINLADEVEYKLMKESLKQSINKLKYDYRILLFLYYIEEMSYKEISKLLQLSEPVIAQRLVRARRKLLQHFTEKWDDPLE